MPTSSADNLPPDDEVIELDPTALEDRGELWSEEGVTALIPGVTLVESSAPSLAGETDPLRRRRLLGSAVVLAVTFGLLCVWVFASDNPGTLSLHGSRYSLRVGLLGLRCLLAAAVAGFLASEVPLDRRPLRVVEYVLFLGETLLLMTAQYFVGLELSDRGPDYAPIALAFIKDGVIQMLALMMIYATLIPNSPAVAARLLLGMFTGPIAVMLLLAIQPGVAPIAERLHQAEESGSNILFLAIAMALAIYGAYLVNGLRVRLHNARKLGQYQLVRKLGEGGMGEVYFAVHQLLKRPCALKRIKAGSASDAIALARFEREVQSAARLAHPNTIEIYDYGHADDGTFYYVMEYLEGMSLSDLVRRTGPLPAGRVIYLLRQVCAGLAEAHALGLVHRDLKPANIFVAVRGGESDVVKVLDFGLVKLTRDPDAAVLTGEMMVSGTPAYMAPEQAVGDRSLDTRADVYALGAVMYFALTSQPPFRAESPFEVMMSHARDPVVPPSRIRTDVPEDLEHIILRCLAKKRGERFPSVRALGDALAACRSASDWGPHRAKAWWAAERLEVPIDAPPIPSAARPVTSPAAGP